MAEDDDAYDYLLDAEKFHPGNFSLVRTDYNMSSVLLKSPHIRREGFPYGSRQYRNLMLARPSRLLSVACNLMERQSRGGRGQPRLIFADVDSVWRKNPIPILETYLDGEDHLPDENVATAEGSPYDLVAQMDNFKHDPIGYCAGFLAMTMSTKVLQLLDKWDIVLQQQYEDGTLDEANDQAVLQQLLVSNWTTQDLGLKHTDLPMSLFPPGHLYFHNSTTTNTKLLMKNDDNRNGTNSSMVPTKNNSSSEEGSEDPDPAIVVHNNWSTGHRNKMIRFQRTGLWSLSEGSPDDKKMTMEKIREKFYEALDRNKALQGSSKTLNTIKNNTATLEGGHPQVSSQQAPTPESGKKKERASAGEKTTAESVEVNQKKKVPTSKANNEANQQTENPVPGRGHNGKPREGKESQRNETGKKQSAEINQKKKKEKQMLSIKPNNESNQSPENPAPIQGHKGKTREGKETTRKETGKMKNVEHPGTEPKLA